MPYDEYLRDLADDARRMQIVRTLAKQLLEARAAVRRSIEECARCAPFRNNPRGMRNCSRCDDAQKVLDGE